MEEDYEWIRASESKLPPRVKTKPRLDLVVTHLVGKPVMLNDPRLIRLVVQWKGKIGSSVDDEQVDNFMRNPEFLKELKETFK